MGGYLLVLVLTRQISQEQHETPDASAKMQAYRSDESYWPHIRSIFQEPLAEFLGVTVAVMFGSGSVAQALLSKAQSGTYPDNYGNWWTVCWGWGFGKYILHAI